MLANTFNRFFSGTVRGKECISPLRVPEGIGDLTREQRIYTGVDSGYLTTGFLTPEEEDELFSQMKIFSKTDRYYQQKFVLQFAIKPGTVVFESDSGGWPHRDVVADRTTESIVYGLYVEHQQYEANGLWRSLEQYNYGQLSQNKGERLVIIEPPKELKLVALQCTQCGGNLLINDRTMALKLTNCVSCKTPYFLKM